MLEYVFETFILYPDDSSYSISRFISKARAVPGSTRLIITPSAIIFTAGGWEYKDSNYFQKQFQSFLVHILIVLS